MKIFNKSEWKKVKLGDICEVVTGSTPLKKIKEYWDKNEVPFITPPELKYEGINYITPNIYVSKIGAKQGRIIPKNSICVCCIGSLGKLGILKEDAITNQQINSLILKDKNVDLLYLYFYLKTIKNNLESISSSTTVKIINKSSFEKIDINLPSLEIQKKISKKLELLENNINFRKSQLNSLNELSKSLFTKYSIGEKESIANLCYVKARIGWQGLTKKEYLSNGEYYLITGVDFKNEKIDFKNCFYVTKERYNQDENIKVKINDILLTKDGTIGKVAIVDKLEKPATLNSGVFVLRPKVNNLNVTYLMHSLISEDFKKFIDDIKIGATVPHLNQAALLKYKLILPPIELQNKFAERIEKIEKLKFEIEKSIETAQNLYDSLISKYFDN